MKDKKLPRLKPIAILCMALALPLSANLTHAANLTSEEIAAVKGDGIDNSVRPGQDFNKYANGGWEKNAKIPDSKSEVGLFDMLAEESDDAVARIIQKTLQAEPGTAARKIADYYQAYLNTPQSTNVD